MWCRCGLWLFFKQLVENSCSTAVIFILICETFILWTAFDIISAIQFSKSLRQIRSQLNIQISYTGKFEKNFAVTCADFKKRFTGIILLLNVYMRVNKGKVIRKFLNCCTIERLHAHLWRVSKLPKSKIYFRKLFLEKIWYYYCCPKLKKICNYWKSV